MLDQILGSKTAQMIFLHLYHHGESYASAVARDFHVSVGQVQRQFDRFEQTGIIISKLSGKTRVYQFNQKNSLTKPFKELVGLIYNSILITEKEQIFITRRRPRIKGKPVMERTKA